MSPCGVFNVNAGAAVPGLSRLPLLGAGASEALLSSICPTPGISCGWNPTFAAATRSDLGAFRSAAVGLAGPGAEGAWLSRFSTADHRDDRQHHAAGRQPHLALLLPFLLLGALVASS